MIFGTIQNTVMMSLLVGAQISESWMDVSFWATLFKLALLVLGPAFSAFGYLYLIKKGDAVKQHAG